MDELLWYRGKRYCGWVHPDFEPPARLLEYPETAGELPQAEHLLDCEARQIFRLPLTVGGQPRLSWTYHFSNSSLSRSLQSTYAFQVLRISHKLRQRGIDTLKILAALKKKGEMFNRHSFLVAQEIPSVYEMASAGQHVFQIHPTVEFSSPIAASLARYLAMFHGRGFFHGDLKTRHILVQHDRNSDYQFYFVDLEKCRYLSFLPGRLRDILAARDLIQLFASLPADARKFRERFLRDYARALNLSSSRQRWLRKLVTFYDPGRGLRQGEPMLTSLWKRITR